MPEPQYERIARTLRERITSGELAPGERLPTERALMDEFDVSVTVARAAVAALRTEGLIYSQQGRGSFVRDSTPLHRWATNRYVRHTKPPFKREAEEGGWLDEVTSDISTLSASPRVAERLHIEPGEQLSQVVYHWYGNKELVQVSTQWEPLKLISGTEIEIPSSGEVGKPDVITRFDKIGINVTRVQELITARMPTPDEAHEFQTIPGVPVFSVERTHWAGDLPVETSDIVIRADRYVIDAQHEVPL